MNKYELQGKIMYLMHQYIEQNFDDEEDWMYWLMMGTPDACDEAYCTELAICPNVFENVTEAFHKLVCRNLDAKDDYDEEEEVWS